MAIMKKINVIGLAKFQAILMAPLGLITGIVYSFGNTINDLVTTGSVYYSTVLAYLALIIHPVMFAIAGLLLGLIEALIYNLIAKKFGGIDFELN